MEERDKQAKSLLDKYHKGLTEPIDRLRIEQAFNRFADLAQDDDLDLDTNLIGPRIWSRLPHTLSDKVVRPLKLWPRYVAAIAAAVALIVFGVWFFDSPQSESDLAGQIKDHHIVPGGAGATLTLANGKTIALSEASNGTLIQEAGVQISKAANGQLVYKIGGRHADADNVNTLSTAPGETFSVRLPEGSVVWLNAGSSLSYSPALLKKGKRLVKLTGEGYFEVAKDAAHPFVVQTETQEVQVLGTKFNISNYHNDAETATTLVEGAVKIKNRHFEKLLRPGEQALNSGKVITTNKADVEAVCAWKDGYFRFNEEGIKEIVKELERWYNVKIELDDKLAYIRFTGKILRTRDISHILKLMQETNNIKFEIGERRIRIIEK